MTDTNDNRLEKPGKGVVTSGDLKVEDSKIKNDITFKPTFELADIDHTEDMIISHDWILQTTETIVTGPPFSLEFKHKISKMVSNSVEFTNSLE